MRPLVSVIMPTYNRADYLPYAIKSVLGQTYQELELHIINDGSTDNTDEVVESFASDKRVRYHCQINKGQSAARNVGIEKSRGEYICLLDSDNLWVDDKLEIQLKYFIENPDADIIYGDGQSIDEHGRDIATQPIKRYSGHITASLLISNYISNNTAICKSRCFREMGSFDENLRYAEDYDLWLRFSTKYKFKYTPRIYTKYRVSGDRLSSNVEAVLDCNNFILRRFLDKNGSSLSAQTIRKTWCMYYVRYGRYYASQTMRLKALKNYYKAFKYGPVSIAPWRAFLKLVLTGK